MLTQCRLLLPSVQVLFRSIDDPIDSILMDTRVELNDFSVVDIGGNGIELRVEEAATAAAEAQTYEKKKRFEKNDTKKRGEEKKSNFINFEAFSE